MNSFKMNINVICEETNEEFVLRDVRFHPDYMDFPTDEFGALLMPENEFNWWYEYNSNFNEIQDKIINEIDGGINCDQYYNFIDGTEFNDFPMVMEAYYNKYKGDKQK